jgi:hypothetical protein
MPCSRATHGFAHQDLPHCGRHNEGLAGHAAAPLAAAPCGKVYEATPQHAELRLHA